MNIVTDSRCTGYHRLGHPERPARIQASVDALKGQTTLACEWITPLEVSDEQVLRAHDRGLLESVRRGSEDFDGDTPTHPQIGQHALRSVGGALRALTLARKGQWAFSLLRPPGHHATRHHAMGFCYFDSIAIAALEARASGVKRVAVYDFDVHHGNGTEDIFLGQTGTAFFSVHQFPCYPGTGEAHRGDNCFNFPVPPMTPRRQYRATLERGLRELQKFKPDLVGVSAGFDAYAKDPLAQGTLEAEDYYWLGQQFRFLGIPVFSVLEGGYSEELPQLIIAYLKGLEGK
ncbi:MAG: histone deacetylase [Verrucomicrobiales bacterium]|nr:histone deacetylase [Verrucomicrobiales bacterium]